MSDIELRILLTAQDAASSIFKKVASAALGDSGLGGALATAASLGGAALLGLAATSVQMAAGYQQSMLKVQALTGTSASDMQWFSDQILAMAPKLGVAPKALMDGLYNVESALSATGATNAQMLSVLQLSAQAASTGNFDMATSTDALTTALNAFHTPASQAGDVMDALTQTVVDGKMQWPNFARALSTIAVGAHNAHISLAESGAALADFTNQGMSAQRASTNLAMLFLDLSTKTDTISKNFDKLYATSGKSQAWDEVIRQSKLVHGHLYTVATTVHHAAQAWSIAGATFDKAGWSSMNLAQKISYLNKITSAHGETVQQQQSELLKLFGGNSRVLTSYNMLSSSMGVYHTNLKNITEAEKNGKTTAQAFATTQQGFNAQLKDAQAALDVVFIQIGEQLLPVVTKFLQEDIIPLVDKFAQWVQQSGFVHQATTDLVDIIQVAIGFVGGFAQGLGDVIGWFQQSGPQGDILKGILIAIGAVIAEIKIVDLISSFATFITQTVPNFVGTAIPRLLGAMGLGGLVTKSDEATTAVSDICSETESTAACMETQTATMSADMASVETAAAETAGESGIASIGPAIEAEAGTVEVESAAMGASISAMLGPIGLVTAGIGLMVPQIQTAVSGAVQALKTQLLDSPAYQALLKLQQQQTLKVQSGEQHQQQVLQQLSVLDAPQSAGGQWSYDSQTQSWVQDPNTGGKKNIPGFASGVTNFGGGLAYVHGGELLVSLPTGTSVLPSRGGSGSGHGGFGTTITNAFTINGATDPSAVAQAVMTLIADQMRFQGITQSMMSGGPY